MTNAFGTVAVEPLVEGVPPELLGIGAGWLIVCIGIIALLRGNLVPRRTLDDAIHDRDEWRAEGRIKDAQIAELHIQVGHLAEVGKTVEQLARGLQQEIRP